MCCSPAAVLTRKALCDFRYEYLASDGNRNAQVAFGTLLLEQLSENSFSGIADSRSLGSLFASPRSSHDHSLGKPSLAKGLAKPPPDQTASSPAPDGSDHEQPSIFAKAMSYATDSLKAFADAQDGSIDGVSSISNAAGLASVSEWLLQVVHEADILEAQQLVDGLDDSEAPSSADVGSAMFVLGKIALAQGQPDEAREWFERGASKQDAACTRELGARALYSNRGGRRGWHEYDSPQVGLAARHAFL
mgnify:CR=1 FL=1